MDDKLDQLIKAHAMMHGHGAPDDCTHDCSTCGSACAVPDGERKPSFFDRMDQISTVLDDVGEDEILRILNETVDEWEAADEAKENK